MGGGNSKEQDRVPFPNHGENTERRQDGAKADSDMYASREGARGPVRAPWNTKSDGNHIPAGKHGGMDSDLFFTLHKQYGESENDPSLEAEVKSGAGRKLGDMGFSQLEIKDAIVSIKKTLRPGLHRKSVDEVIAMIIDQRMLKDRSVITGTQSGMDRHAASGTLLNTVDETLSVPTSKERDIFERRKMTLLAAEERMKTNWTEFSRGNEKPCEGRQQTHSLSSNDSAVTGKYKASEKEREQTDIKATADQIERRKMTQLAAVHKMKTNLTESNIMDEKTMKERRQIHSMSSNHPSVARKYKTPDKERDQDVRKGTADQIERRNIILSAAEDRIRTHRMDISIMTNTHTGEKERMHNMKISSESGVEGRLLASQKEKNQAEEHRTQEKDLLPNKPNFSTPHDGLKFQNKESQKPLVRPKTREFEKDIVGMSVLRDRHRGRELEESHNLTPKTSKPNIEAEDRQLLVEEIQKLQETILMEKTKTNEGTEELGKRMGNLTLSSREMRFKEHKSPNDKMVSSCAAGPSLKQEKAIEDKFVSGLRSRSMGVETNHTTGLTTEVQDIDRHSRERKKSQIADNLQKLQEKLEEMKSGELRPRSQDARENEVTFSSYVEVKPSEERREKKIVVSEGSLKQRYQKIEKSIVNFPPSGEQDRERNRRDDIPVSKVAANQTSEGNEGKRVIGSPERARQKALQQIMDRRVVTTNLSNHQYHPDLSEQRKKEDTASSCPNNDHPVAVDKPFQPFKQNHGLVSESLIPSMRFGNHGQKSYSTLQDFEESQKSRMVLDDSKQCSKDGETNTLLRSPLSTAECTDKHSRSSTPLSRTTPTVEELITANVNQLHQKRSDVSKLSSSKLNSTDSGKHDSIASALLKEEFNRSGNKHALHIEKTEWMDNFSGTLKQDCTGEKDSGKVNVQERVSPMSKQGMMLITAPSLKQGIREVSCSGGKEEIDQETIGKKEKNSVQVDALIGSKVGKDDRHFTSPTKLAWIPEKNVTEAEITKERAHDVETEGKNCDVQSWSSLPICCNVVGQNTGKPSTDLNPNFDKDKQQTDQELKVPLVTSSCETKTEAPKQTITIKDPNCMERKRFEREDCNVLAPRKTQSDNDCKLTLRTSITIGGKSSFSEEGKRSHSNVNVTAQTRRQSSNDIRTSRKNATAIGEGERKHEEAKTKSVTTQSCKDSTTITKMTKTNVKKQYRADGGHLKLQDKTASSRTQSNDGRKMLPKNETIMGNIQSCYEGGKHKQEEKKYILSTQMDDNNKKASKNASTLVEKQRHIQEGKLKRGDVKASALSPRADYRKETSKNDKMVVEKQSYSVGDKLKQKDAKIVSTISTYTGNVSKKPSRNATTMGDKQSYFEGGEHKHGAMKTLTIETRSADKSKPLTKNSPTISKENGCTDGGKLEHENVKASTILKHSSNGSRSESQTAKSVDKQQSCTIEINSTHQDEVKMVIPSENINKEATDGTENKQKREESISSKRNENSVDNIIGNSVAKNPKMKETVLHLKFWTVMKCEDEILKSLIGIIAEVPFKVDKIAYSNEENWTKLDIKFASVSMSRTFCSQLRRNRDKFGIRFETPTPAPKKKDMKMIEDQLKSMCKRSAELLQWHLSLEKMEENKLISLAEDKGGKNKKGKYVSIDKFNQRESQRRALIDKIGEYKGQRNEFQIRLAEITKKLEAMKHEECMKESLRDVMKDFNIEYSRLKDSLPMYAKRTDIVELIKENQVSIILGETGSGKSTQLTQYIYQANMANGLIVCTQPRKVAAISLASRVAQEMNDNVGHLVGYHVGMKSKKNPQTKILYMTDHLLLNECLEDNLLQKYSCIIIDEAHERSIYTDLLLGMIKSILPFRDDLRVVVTSATINPEVFVDYFGYAPVLRVSGRMFPVGVEWCPSSFNDIDDYEDRALRKALEVHEKEPPGDILVFLTSQLEIERSIEKMEAYLKGRRDAIIMPLHGKLQADEQGRIFDATPKGKRKIVFATNIAETSLTIPGVKYVIDTGFAKEMTFDPSRNLSSLDVSYISKSSAEQRKGRAGRTDVGKCFRLYARETFDSMREIAAPEILKIHLGHAILKLLQLDVNPLEFDFVEAPSKAFLDSAYDTLQNLDCVADGKITAKGKWIAKLPLSPNLGSLVHDAVESEKSHGKEIAIEGVVLAACCTTGGSLFYRAGSIEQKREADKRKVPFCHSAGDHLTYLNVYREWHKVEEKRKGRWCRENSVNGKAMRGIRETVNEILQTLKKELGVRLHFTLSQTSSNDEILQSFIFKAFMTNVCYFLGHQKAGYHFIDKNQRVTVHPSSAIESLGSQPSWVVLERVMKTSKEFALNITVVKEEDVMDALSRGFLTFDLDAVKKQRVEEVCVEFVGSQLHREFVGVRYKNVKQMEEDLSSEGNDIFIVEADRSKGAVSVFTTEENKTLSESVLKESISPLREKIKFETVEIPLTDNSMNILATIGPGGSTVDISAPNEYKTILVYSAADEMFDEKEVRRLFERKFGQVREVIIKSPHSTNVEYWGKVTFVDPEAAAAAVAELNEKGSEIWTRPTLRVSREQNSFRATVSWCRRRGKGFGFVQIHDASLLSSLCNKREIIVANSHARVTRSKKTADEVHIAGFNELVDEGVLKESVVNAIQALDDDIGKVVVVREKVQTSPDMMQTFKRRLKAKIESYVKPGSFRINLMQPLDGHTTYRGSVIFDDPDAGDLACKRIDRKFMMMDRVVSMVPNLEAIVHVKARVYKMVEKDITRVIKSTEENDDMHVKQKKLRNSDIVIEIHSNDISELGRIKARLEKILRGDTLEYEMRNLDKILYSRQGRDELQKIMRDTNTEIALDNRNMFINIYGQSLNRQTAMRRVCLYLDKIKHSHCKILELRGQDKPVGYMKAVIVKYGADLESLKTEFELNSVELNHRLHKLTLLGEEDKVQRCAETIKTMEVELMASLGQQATGPKCGICFCEIDSNELYRLESCGHPYCEDCVKGQVESLVSSRDFPLKCTFENCENLWAWQDVMSMAKRGFISKDAVVSSSVSSFVGANKESYRFCLTPDCPLVYKVSKDGKIFRCPDCDLRICTSCHVESHTGLSCAMYKASNGNDEDGVFRWMMQDPGNRKLCPCCSQCIEKNQGCQHMECSICHTHICWICMATFKTSGECYGHLHRSHGTFM